jgi:CYTH domain-containing protein
VTSWLAGEGRYAQLEREQRWVLDAVPSDVTDKRIIADSYLVGTRLRLRKVQSGGETTLKLCQKVRLEEDDPERVKITNFYISPEEYGSLLSLSSATIVKTRYSYLHEGIVFGIDHFEGRHAGLLLAETEIGETDAMHPLPAFGRLEVTGDNRYSGGWLAFASDNELQDLFARSRNTI